MAITPVKLISIFFILISIFSTHVLSDNNNNNSSGCESESESKCTSKHRALPLKLIAIFAILITSIIGVSMPLLTRSIPALSPERDVFVVVKALAAGVILATGFMHVLPDSFEMLSSNCLSQNPWHKFPFTGFVAMLSAIVTMMVDSMATSVYSRKNSTGVKPEAAGDQEMGVAAAGHYHGHGHQHGTQDESTKLMRYRVVAMVSFSILFINEYVTVIKVIIKIIRINNLTFIKRIF